MSRTGRPSAAPTSHFARRRVSIARLVVLGALALVVTALTPRALDAREPVPSIDGVALDVQDGDSFTMRTDDGRRLRVRVSGIDAPESTQPHADVSRRRLGELLRERRLRIDPVKRDVFERTVARVWVLGDDDPPRDAALAQLDAGLAWHFTRYRADQTPADYLRYARAERDARARRAGLWRADTAEPPWEFRARARRDESRGSTAPRERASTPPRAD